MTDLDLYRKLFATANADGGDGTGDSTSSEGDAQTTLRYGTVQFAGDGSTSYTYTAADGTSITVTLETGEYAVLLDTGETVTIRSDVPLGVGDRVTLMYQGSQYVLVASQSIVAYVNNTSADAIQEATKAVEDKGKEIEDSVDSKLSDYRADYDAFKANHTYTDDDITKKVTDSASSTKTEYEAAISTATESLATKSELETGLEGVNSSITEKYTETTNSIKSVSDDLDAAKTDLADNYVSKTDTTYTYISEKQSDITQTIDQVQSVIGQNETLTDGVNALASVQANSVVTQRKDEITSAVTKDIEDNVLGDYVKSSQVSQTADGLAITINGTVYTGDTVARNAASAAQSTADDANTAAGNAQSTADTANSTANAASDAASTANSNASTALDKSTAAATDAQTVYYVSNVQSTPSKPDSEISTTADILGGWTLAKPEITDSYKYIYHCTQYHDGNGTPHWTAVAMDYAATSLKNGTESVETTIENVLEGVQVTTKTGKTVYVSTYTAAGVVSMNTVYSLETPYGVFGVKDWGCYYGNYHGKAANENAPQGTYDVQAWITSGSYQKNYSGTSASNSTASAVRVPGQMFAEAYDSVLTSNYARLSVSSGRSNDSQSTAPSIDIQAHSTADGTASLAMTPSSVAFNGSTMADWIVSSGTNWSKSYSSPNSLVNWLSYRKYKSGAIELDGKLVFPNSSGTLTLGSLGNGGYSFTIDFPSGYGFSNAGAYNVITQVMTSGPANSTHVVAIPGNRYASYFLLALWNNASSSVTLTTSSQLVIGIHVAGY